MSDAPTHDPHAEAAALATYPAGLDRQADRLARAEMALEALLSVADRHGLGDDPLDRMAIEKARAVLADGRLAELSLLDTPAGLEP